MTRPSAAEPPPRPATSGRTSHPDHAPWWQRAVVYQIYPRSFLDTDGDGVGDLGGIAERLDHIASLGVDAIWLSPIFPSPMADFGYDVSDYCGIDPRFGDLAAFDRLVTACHERSLRVLLDWVPNHTSDRHPWFVDSRSSRDALRRNWYVWRDPAPDGGPPNNWIAAFGDAVPAWTFDETTGQYYLHNFLPEQPDLNWAEPEVLDAMTDVLRFWLDRGVDGFRIDVVHLIGKDPALPDDPPDVAGLPHCVLNHRPETHPLLAHLRRAVDAYPQQPVTVGEVFLLDTAMVAEYYGDGDELHLAFNFPPLYAPWDATAWRAEIERAEALLAPRGWPAWVLSNHDQKRHRTRYGTDARARAAAVLLLTLRGTPFLYAGEELGLEDAAIPPDRVVDPGGRDGCRGPIPWDAEALHGWPSDPWLPFPPDAAARSVAAQEHDPSSMLALYRAVLDARRSSPALAVGELELLDAPDGVLAYRRHAGDDSRIVLVNFTADTRSAPEGTPGLPVTVGTDPSHAGHPFSGVLAPDEAVVLVARP